MPDQVREPPADDSLASGERDLALAPIVSLVVRPGSRLSTLAWWSNITPGALR